VLGGYRRLTFRRSRRGARGGTRSKAREKDARGRAIYEARVAGETWEAIANAHGYKSVSGARAAAHRYAERHGLEPRA